MAAANPGYDHDMEKPRCPICFGEFKAPRQLPCNHSFCHGCLEEYIAFKAAKVTELKEFGCPICSTTVFIPRKDKTSEVFASLYPLDLLLQSIEDKDEVHRPCDCCVSDGISVTANGFCIVCEEAMCEPCLKVHQRQKVSKDHTIITIEATTKKPENIINFPKGFHCQEHEGKNLKFYCRDHQIACCSSCCIVHHRHCGQVLEIAIDATSLLKELKPVVVIDEMKKLENHLISFEKKNNSNIPDLESQEQDMVKKIQDIRRKINGILDDFESKVKSEGNGQYKKETIRIQEENRACQALFNAVRNSRMSLQTVMKHGSDNEIFIIADRMISQVKLYYSQIRMKFNETKAVILNLEISSQIKCILAQQCGIGRLIHREECADFLIARPEKPFRQYQFMNEETVEIKGPDDKNPFYTGLTYLQGDEVMLADCNNKKVLLLNSAYQYLSSLTLQQPPWDFV
ncbi:hypothetical protein CHS0354_001696 [Potamilus streckersoni]|uniref:Uncharacterized protein n=1 Tax=Potamilus streckersoni TaxID=2493646 RepID=A0AAE0S051_9BIVA|nr:hypothetical protein CHS0354_001696 [Potamilus streckersoni]